VLAIFPLNVYHGKKFDLCKGLEKVTAAKINAILPFGGFFHEKVLYLFVFYIPLLSVDWLQETKLGARYKP
jgi:hypothetical protein